MKIFQILFCTVAVNGWGLSPSAIWNTVSSGVSSVANTVSSGVSSAVNHFKPRSGFSKSENYAALKKVEAYNMNLYRQNAYPASITVEWTQHSRCRWECSERFYEWQYAPAGQPDRKYMVWVADGVVAPYSFNTLGYQDMLNFGIYAFEQNGANAIVFVIMPSDWKIFQHRFKSSNLNKLVSGVTTGLVSGAATAAGSAAAGAATGAAFGSVIPVAGTAVGIVAGAVGGYAFSEIHDDYIGHFLRHLG